MLRYVFAIVAFLAVLDIEERNSNVANLFVALNTRKISASEKIPNQTLKKK